MTGVVGVVGAAARRAEKANRREASAEWPEVDDVIGLRQSVGMQSEAQRES